MNRIASPDFDAQRRDWQSWDRAGGGGGGGGSSGNLPANRPAPTSVHSRLETRACDTFQTQRNAMYCTVSVEEVRTLPGGDAFGCGNKRGRSRLCWTKATSASADWPLAHLSPGLVSYLAPTQETLDHRIRRRSINVLVHIKNGGESIEAKELFSHTQKARGVHVRWHLRHRQWTFGVCAAMDKCGFCWSDLVATSTRDPYK